MKQDEGPDILRLVSAFHTELNSGQRKLRKTMEKREISFPGLDSRIIGWLHDVSCCDEISDHLWDKLRIVLNTASWSHGELYFCKSKLFNALVQFITEDTSADGSRAEWKITFFLKLFNVPCLDVQILSCLMLAKSAKFFPEDTLKATIFPLIERLNVDASYRGISLKEVSALALKRLAKRSEDLRVMIGSLGALPILLSLASQSDSRLQTLAVQVLKELVLSTKISQALLNLTGGLQIILNLMNSSSETVQCLSAEILGTLARFRVARRAIANQSGISLLVENTKRGCMLSRRRAAHALGLLAFTKKMRRMIGDAGGIPALIELLRDGDEVARLVAGNSLGIVAACVDHLSQVTRAGAIPPLISLLEGSNPHGKDIAKDTFCVLAVSEENALIVMDHLVRVLHNGGVEAKAAAADIIWDVSSYRHSVSVALVSGAIPILVDLLKDDDVGLREYVSGAIAQLSYNPDDRQALADVGGIPALVELLQDQSNDVKENVSEALHNFAEDSCYRPDITDAQAVPALAALQRNSSTGSMVREIGDHAVAALPLLGNGI